MAKNNTLKYLLIGGAIYAAFYLFRSSKQIKGIGENDSYKYMLLDRLVNDCDYFLGFGNRNPEGLYALNVKDHIKEMKEIYKSLPEKPKWLSYQDILTYEKKMLNEK